MFDDPKPAVRREHPSPMGEKTGTWIGFAPFSAQQGKTYPEPLARETVRLLAGRYDRVFIHSGGGAEAEFAQEMERLHPNVTALFGRVKMAGEIDLIANLDCVVSMDSWRRLWCRYGVRRIPVWDSSGTAAIRAASCRPIWSAARARSSEINRAVTEITVVCMP